jgi:nucleoside-diphosphate-sugar epimerase
MLGLAKRINARFLLTSTSEVYGDPLQHPQVETYWGNVNPIGVRSCYDEGKRTAETLTMDYHRGANLEVIRHPNCRFGWLGFHFICVEISVHLGDFLLFSG